MLHLNFLAFEILLLNISLANSLKSFEPYGKGNEKMIFSSLKVSISDIKIIGKNSNVLKMKRKQNEIQREFICFSDIDTIIKKIGVKDGPFSKSIINIVVFGYGELYNARIR